MLGGKGIGRVGYDKKELDAMEKDVERVEKGEASPTKTPAKIPAKGKGKERASGYPANPLKVIIMSATLDAEKFSSFFGRYAEYFLRINPT